MLVGHCTLISRSLLYDEIGPSEVRGEPARSWAARWAGSPPNASFRRRWSPRRPRSAVGSGTNATKRLGGSPWGYTWNGQDGRWWAAVASAPSAGAAYPLVLAALGRPCTPRSAWRGKLGGGPNATWPRRSIKHWGSVAVPRACSATARTAWRTKTKRVAPVTAGAARARLSAVTRSLPRDGAGGVNLACGVSGGATGTDGPGGGGVPPRLAQAPTVAWRGGVHWASVVARRP